ncbi:MAG TPA: AI-2E family transporter [Gammaproteobacteria bacterium]
MVEVIRGWLRRYLSDPQAIVLLALLVVGFGIVLFLGGMLTPVFAALVIAFLLEGLVRQLEHLGVSRLRSVILVFTLFMTLLLLLLLGLTPLVWTQLVELVRELPNFISRSQAALHALPQHYQLVTDQQINDLLDLLQKRLAEQGQRLLALTIAGLPGLITLLVYLVLVPLLVFFFLKDKQRLIGWVSGFVPENHGAALTVWHEVEQQLGNYVRGKFWEIFIVGVASVIAFALLGLKYAMLLGALVGLSVIVPYIGAAVVTIPVALIAWLQWGGGPDFAWLMIVYAIIQGLDGNVLVPLLFSKVVNLHPVAVIVAVLVFGGLWGFWGVFFAIPLATLVNAILHAWPRNNSATR